MEENIFKGMVRKRLPALHMIIALEGNVPLREALAGHFFIMLHDKIKHNCLIEQKLKKLEEDNLKVILNCKTPDSAGLGLFFGGIANLGICGQEWSYLSQEDAFIFYLIANTAIEETQRWISEGVEPPHNISMLGNLVERPQWAGAWHEEKYKRGKKSRALVQRLREEIGE
jgi:hypothetical protein